MSEGPRVLYTPRLKEVLVEAAAAYRRWDDPEVERLLRRAVDLAPQRLDIHYNLAGRYIQSGETVRALACYRRILDAAPDEVDALTYFAHWSRHEEETADAEAAWARLNEVRPGRAADLKRIWDRIDADAGRPVTDVFPPDAANLVRQGVAAAIVILGFKLNPDGSMHDIMARRLEKGLEAAELFPLARIIVTGGVPAAGRVEAVVMREWLLENGVAERRVVEEGYARDVVENCLFSRQIMEAYRIDQALLVTSSVDVRRSRLVLEVANFANGSRFDVAAIASRPGGPEYSRDPGPRDVKIYRDTLRAYGMPMMRVYPEMVEL